MCQVVLRGEGSDWEMTSGLKTVERGTWEEQFSAVPVREQLLEYIKSSSWGSRWESEETIV